MKTRKLDNQKKGCGRRGVEEGVWKKGCGTDGYPTASRHVSVCVEVFKMDSLGSLGSLGRSTYNPVLHLSCGFVFTSLYSAVCSRYFLLFL